MQQEVIKKLVKLDIFGKEDITETEYNNNKNDKTYLSFQEPGNYGEYNEVYWRVDTRGLTPDDIDLLLKIDQAKNIRTIKNAAIFFVALSVISIVISIIGAVSLL